MGTVGALAIVSLGALWESVSRVPSMEHRVCTESRNSRVRIFCTCRSSHFHHVQAIHRQGRANAALFESFACVRPPRARQMKRATTLLQLVAVPRTARQPPVREPARQPHQDYSRDGRRYPAHRRRFCRCPGPRRRSLLLARPWRVSGHEEQRNPSRSSWTSRRPGLDYTASGERAARCADDLWREACREAAGGHRRGEAAILACRWQRYGKSGEAERRKCSAITPGASAKGYQHVENNRHRDRVASGDCFIGSGADHEQGRNSITGRFAI